MEFTNTQILINIGIAVAAVVIGYLVFRSLPRLFDWMFEHLPGFNTVNKTFAYFVSDSVGIALVLAVALFALSFLPESAALVAILITVISGAFIFTSEGWVSDAIAGVMLQIFPQFEVGDWVTIGGDKRGQVKRLGLLRTELETIQLDIVSVRNGRVSGEDIINHTGRPFRQVIITVHTADYGEYGAKIQTYKRDIEGIALRVQDAFCPEANALEGRVPQVHFMAFGPSSDHLDVTFYTYDRDDALRPAVDAMHTALAERLRSKGVVLGQVTANTIDNAIKTSVALTNPFSKNRSDK